MIKPIRIWIGSLILSATLIGLEAPIWLSAPLLLFFVTTPCVLLVYWSYKMMRFLLIPTPRQLLKGFKRQWVYVKRGPVVTRVHRPRPSSRTP